MKLFVSMVIICTAIICFTWYQVEKIDAQTVYEISKLNCV